MNRGVVSAATGFVLWGLFPLYFRMGASGPALEVLSNRIVWALVFMLVVMTWLGRWAWLVETLRRPRVVAIFFISALLLSTNWLTYIWSVQHGHVVDASLGYFMTPLVNVALGYTVLRERPRPGQWAALGLAVTGVVWLTVQSGQVPWIGLGIALSFGAYGLLRKIAVLGSLEGLTLETILLSPLAFVGLLWWWSSTPDSFPAADLRTNLWLIGLGPLTAIPLLLFASGARSLSMTTLGVLQYLSPTLQFVLGVWLFGEAVDAGRLIGFGFIWLALLLYSAEGWRVPHQPSTV
jgi:chloramphenicol-sensitive protein RarD